MDKENLKNAILEKELLLDTFRVKGICSYRVCDTLEAIKCFNASHNIEKDLVQMKSDLER